MASPDIKVVLSATDKTAAAFASAKRNLAGLSSSAAGLTRTLGAAIPALTGLGFVAMAKGAIDAADALKDMSERTLVSVKDLASLKLVAEQSGTDLESVAKGIQKITLSVGQAQGGSKEMVESLQRLGVTSKDARERLFQIADAYAKSGDKAKITADIQKVLGKSYAELLPVLSQGGDELRKAALASESFAEAMARAAPNADQFNDNMALLKQTAAGFAVNIVADMLPALNKITAAMREAYEESGFLQAAWVGLGGLGAAIFTDEFKSDLTKLKNLKKQLADIEGAPLPGLLASEAKRDAMRAEIKQLEASIAAAQAAAAKAKADKPAAPGALNLPSAPAAAAKADPLASLLGSTEVGKVAEFEKLMGLLNARFAAGKIGAEQYKQATEKLFANTFSADIDKVNKALEYNAETEQMVAEHLEETNNAINAQKQAWIDAGAALTNDVKTPMEDLAARLSYLDELLSRGVISWDTWARASLDAQEKIDAAAPKIDETKNLFDELGTTITAAFAGLGDGAKSTEDIMKGLAASIVKVIAQVLILEPLIKALKESMGSTSGGSSSGSGLGSLVSGAASDIGSWIGSLFAFEQGGVMGPMGPVPLRRYAMGGVANSPQLAMFGEGSQSEAYVPLPDGRRIPVVMNGGGGQVINNITIRTDNPSNVRASRGQMLADIQNELRRAQRNT